MRSTFGIGVALFATAMVAGAWAMTSIPAPSFAVSVDPDSAFAPDGEGHWTVAVTPAADADRLVAQLDRETTLALEREGKAGLTTALSDLSPGYHFIEAAVWRRGGRVDQVVDVVAAGPFQADQERGCDVALGLSPDAVRMLLLPAIEHKVLAAAVEQEHFGPTSHISESTLAVVEGGLAFTLTLDTTEEGKGDLRIEGEVAVASVGNDGISLQLRDLGHAGPGPKLAELAGDKGAKYGRGAGIGSGAAVGAFVGGPIGAVIGGVVGGFAGDEVGELVGTREARRQTRTQVHDALISGLAVATTEMTLPGQIALLPAASGLVADVQWCGPLVLNPDEGLRAALSLVIVDDEYTALAQEVAVLGPTALESVADIPAGFNTSAAVSQNLVNRLLAEWTVRGGFDVALDAAGIGSAVEAELGARTRWRVENVSVDLPPVVLLHEDRIDVSLGGIAMRMVDPGRDQTRDIMVGGVGSLRLDVASGATARLGGSLSAAYFGCRLPGEAGRVLPACFSAAVDPELIRKKINVAIVLNTARMPAIDLSTLVQMRVTAATGSPAGLKEAAVTVGGGTLRLDGTLGH